MTRDVQCEWSLVKQEDRGKRGSATTYHGRLFGSCFVGRDVVRIAHGKQSVDRSVLVTAYRVDDVVSRERKKRPDCHHNSAQKKDDKKICC